MSLMTDLVEYWPLNEASGTRAGLHASKALTDNNTVLSGTGLIYATVADFERSNTEWLSRANDTDLAVSGHQDYTYAMWVKLESKTGNMAIISKMEGASPFAPEWRLQYRVSDVGNEDRFRANTYSDGGAVGTGVYASSLGAPALATWYLLVVWHDATADTLNIQGNNGTVNSAAHSTGGWDGSHSFYVGGVNGLDTYDGLLGPLMFWRRVLTSQERSDLYNGAAGLSYAAFTPSLVFPVSRRAMHHSRRDVFRRRLV